MEKCRLCNSNKMEKVWENNYNLPLETGIRQIKVSNCICMDCGIIFQEPQISDEDMEFLYKYQYRFNINKETAFQSRKEQYEYTRKYSDKSSGKILDIGCGEAYFLSFFSEEWEKYGIEPSSTCVERARTNFPNTHIECGFYEDKPYQKDFFDIITIRHVLEHVKDPMVVLKKIRDELNATGILYVEVPNVHKAVQLEDITDFFGYQHTYHFSPATITNFLCKSGFEIIELTTDLSYSAMRVIAKKSEHSHQEIKNDYRFFSENFKQSLNKKMQIRKDIQENLKQLNEQWKREKKKILIYGAGMHTEELIKLVDFEEYSVAGLLDKSKEKQGKNFFGYPVFSPEDIKKLDVQVIIISSFAFQDEIYDELKTSKEFKGELIKLYKNINMKPYLS